MVCTPDTLKPGDFAGEVHVMCPFEKSIIGNLILIVSCAIYMKNKHF